MSRVLSEREKLLQICSDIDMSRIEDYVLSGHQVSRQDMIDLKNWKIDKARRDAEAAQPPNKFTEKVRILRIKYMIRKIKEGKMPECASLLSFLERELKEANETAE